MSNPNSPTRPSWPWRITSTAVVASVTAIARGFLYGLNKPEVTGLHNLLDVLDRRKNQARDRGLLTVCNHVAVCDDPLLWGILPLRYAIDVENIRWGLGAHDICFANRFLSTFFTLGQVLPTHRLWHSKKGGLYQPTMTEAIKLLSGHPARAMTASERLYSTNGVDLFQSPASYAAYRHAWVHVFPEACCHQNSENTLRYFKWGVARLILETEPAPQYIPMFMSGTQDIMNEERGFPRFLPRIGKRVRIVIGEALDADQRFGQHRAAWKRLVAETPNQDDLIDNPEAVKLRIDVAKAVRDDVSKLRESAGFAPDQDDTAALAETWSKEPNKRRFKSPVDGSFISEH